MTTACGESGGGDEGEQQGAVDAGLTQDAAPMANCNETTHRAELAGPFACAGEPEFVTIAGDRNRYDIFKYEASHPLATPTAAFPCAVSDGESWEAPRETTEACSVKGVRPWHSVRWGDADAACKAIGWRLCTGEEATRACEGPDDQAFTWGDTFEAGVCNLRGGYQAEGADRASEAPTGEFEECVSPEGVVDANGNLWEWTGDRDASDTRKRFYRGAGWRLVAEQHRDSDQTCAYEVNVPSISAESYANSHIGFRCCRNAE